MSLDRVRKSRQSHRAQGRVKIGFVSQNGSLSSPGSNLPPVGPGSTMCTLPALCSPPAPVGDPQQASPSAYGKSCQGKQQLQLPRKSHVPAAFALWPGSPPANTPHQHSSVPVPLRQDSDAPRRAGTRALSQSRCDTTLQHTRPRLLPFTPHSVSLSGA